VLDERLQRAPGLHVMGAGAELVLGPTARNIAGARMAAQRLLASQDSIIEWQAHKIRYWRDTVVVAKDQQLRLAQGLLREALNARQPRSSCGVSVTAGYGLRGPDAVVGYGCTLRL